MVRRRVDKVIQHIDKRRTNAAKARAALAVKREKQATEEWVPPPMPTGFPPRPPSVIDYVCDYVSPMTGKAYGNYAAMGRALGVSRQTVHEWKTCDHIPDKYLPAIIMQTGINAATLLVWNAAYVGRPRHMAAA